MVALGITVFFSKKIKKIIIDNPDLNKRLLTPPKKLTGEIKLVPQKNFERKVRKRKKKELDAARKKLEEKRKN